MLSVISEYYKRLLFTLHLLSDPYPSGAPSNGTETSDIAADSIEVLRAGMQTAVYLCICEHGPITCDGVEVLLEGRHQTISARITELYNSGLVQRQNKLPTRSGRPAFTYVRADLG